MFSRQGRGLTNGDRLAAHWGWHSARKANLSNPRCHVLIWKKASNRKSLEDTASVRTWQEVAQVWDKLRANRFIFWLPLAKHPLLPPSWASCAASAFNVSWMRTPRQGQLAWPGIEPSKRVNLEGLVGTQWFRQKDEREKWLFKFLCKRYPQPFDALMRFLALAG